MEREPKERVPPLGPRGGSGSPHPPLPSPNRTETPRVSETLRPQHERSPDLGGLWEEGHACLTATRSLTPGAVLVTAAELIPEREYFVFLNLL